MSLKSKEDDFLFNKAIQQRNRLEAIPGRVIEPVDAPAEAYGGIDSSRRYLVWIWLGARLVMSGLGLYFLRDELIWLATILAIHWVGSLPERIFLGVLFGLMLGGVFIAAQRFALRIGCHPEMGRHLWMAQHLIVLTASFVLFGLTFYLLPGFHPVLAAGFLTLTLALNSIRRDRLVNFFSQKRKGQLADIFFIGGFGLAELLLFRPFLWWLLRRWQPRQLSAGPNRYRFIDGLPATIITPVIATLLLNTYSLAHLHRALFPDPAVQKFAEGNFNGLELDLERRILYASGYGANYLHAYHIDDLQNPASLSPVETGYAQGFGYNPMAQELYVYNQLRQQLLVLDAASLKLKRALPTPQLSPGDAWVIWDKFTDEILIASEADEQQGTPVVVVDRLTGEVVDTLDVAPGFILPHPSAPLLYMSLSFFQKQNDLVIYNIEQRQIVKTAPLTERIDRMAFALNDGELELLVPSALDSVILRLDPETLERKGRIPSLFGARAIAVDPSRNLLLSGSLVANMVEVIDLSTQRQLHKFYIGPWLRTILLDQQTGLAYISTHEGLFRVRYADPAVGD